LGEIASPRFVSRLLQSKREPDIKFAAAMKTGDNTAFIDDIVIGAA